MTKHEVRACKLAAETRADGAPVLRGYAALYHTETVIGDFFREQIAPGAFDDAIPHDDVRALFNHDPNIVLGRTTSGTLALGSDARGLTYEVVLNPADSEHMRVWQMVQRGDVSQSSFGFQVIGQHWEEAARGLLPLRTITKASLFDVSPVTYPAYAETTVTARDLPTAIDDAADVVKARQATDALMERALASRWRVRQSEGDAA